MAQITSHHITQSLLALMEAALGVWYISANSPK
jgi:hypothetical protein